MNAVFTPQRVLIDVEQFQKMGAAGVFRDTRVELVDGELLTMAPIGPGHAYGVDTLTRLLYQWVGEAGQPAPARISTQGPLVLGERSQVEPDVLLLRPSPTDYRQSAPRPPDVLLAIEVADTTLAYDSQRKALHYAAAGVPELWILDLEGRRLLVCRSPSPAGYVDNATLWPGTSASPASLPALRLAWFEALP